MANQSKFNLRQILLLTTMTIGFVAFAVMPLIRIFQAPPPSASQDTPINKENLLKKLEEEEKGYQKVLDREPKNSLALQGVVKARINIFRLTGNVQMLSLSLAPLDEIIKQNPKNDNLLALKKQMQLTINKEGQQPTPNK